MNKISTCLYILDLLYEMTQNNQQKNLIKCSTIITSRLSKNHKNFQQHPGINLKLQAHKLYSSSCLPLKSHNPYQMRISPPWLKPPQFLPCLQMLWLKIWLTSWFTTLAKDIKNWLIPERKRLASHMIPRCSNKQLSTIL